ncbi:hypothetical protein Sjap_003889 [Stephania japonica]|uniref:25S rRNA (uridine-N(3))-methyltransferase BMT5-like domain-containing protein n=1 Tax=Stephania japonica TaxID=461633 RepID=A0AAP0KRD1_9MAGN
MRNQPSRNIIRFLLETEQDMNLTEQELDEWIEQRNQEAEEEIKSILQKISAETMSAIPLKSVEVNEATPIEDYWSEPEEIIEVSLHEPDISIAQNEADEVEKEIYVILERSEEPQKESKEDQPLVLVKPPTLPCIFVRPYKGVAVKERSQIFYTADTFVSDDHDLTDSYVLETKKTRERHQNLVSSFMANAKNMVAERGEIHISHKCYSKFSEQWNLRELAMKNGLVVMEEVKFNLSDYPGYNTKYGFGGDKNFDCNPSKTYKFRLKKRYDSSQKILLVGEGDFSFSACLAKDFVSAANLCDWLKNWSVPTWRPDWRGRGSHDVFGRGGGDTWRNRFLWSAWRAFSLDEPRAPRGTQVGGKIAPLRAKIWECG